MFFSLPYKHGLAFKCGNFDLVGELNAINQYQAHIDTLDNEEAIRVLKHIRDDEKEHVAELTKLIQKLDATQAAKFKKEGL